MKRILTLLAIVMVVCSVLSSCKTHERCPAYGKINKGNIEKSVKPV